MNALSSSGPTENDPEVDLRAVRTRRDLLRGNDAPALKQDLKGEAELAVELQKAGWQDTWRKAAVHADDVDLAIDTLAADVASVRHQLAIERALPALVEGAGVHDVPLAMRQRLERAIDDLFPPEGAAPAAVTLHAEVAGEPVLDRGFSAAVERNHQRSTGIAIVVVTLFMLALFRSVRSAILSMAPAVLTRVVLMGAMGLAGAHIDLGTSLVAGIATGAGADFAMHYLWYLRTEDHERVSRTVIPVAILSVAIVALGFFVLALGRSPVMHLFGGLAGAAMALSALFACFILPATWRGAGGKHRDESAPRIEAEPRVWRQVTPAVCCSPHRSSPQTSVCCLLSNDGSMAPALLNPTACRPPSAPPPPDLPCHPPPSSWC